MPNEGQGQARKSYWTSIMVITKQPGVTSFYGLSRPDLSVRQGKLHEPTSFLSLNFALQEISLAGGRVVIGGHPAGPADLVGRRHTQQSQDARRAPVTPRGDLMAEEKSTIALFKQASPSVLNITSIGIERDMFTLNQYQIPQGTGSGFIWDNTGNVITNFHVIQNADAAQVTLADQSTYKARVVGVAPDKDLAVLKIDAPTSKLPAIPLGTSKDLQVGQSVLCHR